ncbi:lipopolysaccharide biosynthesis protein [Glutamicibacter sp. BSL13]
MKTHNAVILSTSINVGMAMLGAVTGVITARALGPEQRGYLAAIVAWFTISLVVSELGQSAAVTFFTAKNPERSRVYISIARKAMLMGSAIILSVGILCADLLSNGDAQVSMAYRVILIGTLVNAIAAPYVYALQSLSNAFWNIVRFSQPALYLICLLFLHLSGQLSLTTTVLCMIASFIGQLIIAWVLFRPFRQNKLRSSGKEKEELAKYGLAQASYAIPASLTEQYDRVVLSWTVSAYELGQYAVALTVSQASRAFGTAIASVVFPLSAKLGKAESSRVLLERRSLLATALASSVALLLIGWIAQPLVPIVFGDDFREALPLIWLLIPVVWLRGINALIAVFLRGRHYPFYATVGQLLALVCGATMLIFLVPGFGLMSAPIGFFIGETIALLSNIIYLKSARKNAKLS